MRLVQKRATLQFENKLCPHRYKESQISVAPGLLPCLITRQELHLKIILFLATRLEMSDSEKVNKPLRLRSRIQLCLILYLKSR